MKILRFKKLKNNIYELELDNYEKILTYEEVILKYNLLIDKEINTEKLKDIEKSNNYYDCYYKVIRLINRRAFSKKELELKLKSENIDINIINKVLNELEGQGYVNDEGFANGYVNNKIITTTHGPNRIIKDLKEKGIDETIISSAMETYTDDVQKEKIEKIIKRKFKSNHNKSNNYMKIKIQKELLLDGFDHELIESIISNINISDDSNIRQKEFNKLKNKLSKKYSGKELDYKIKEKLAQKGFY